METRLTRSCTVVLAALTFCAASALNSKALATKPAKGVTAQELKEAESSGSLPIDRLSEEQPGSRAEVASVQADSIVGRRFSAFLERVNAVTEDKRSAVVDSFMATISSFPLVEEDTIVHYLYRGNATSVTVPGDANEWNSDAFPMTRIAGTDLWFRQAIFEPDARLDYLLVLNRSTWITDPLNPNRLNDYFGLVSELAMPDYVQPPEIVHYPNIPHGTLHDMSISSTILGNSRTIQVYTPPSYATAENDSFPVVLFHDGGLYVSLCSADNVLDYLISENRIQPVIAVFVPAVNPNDEYEIIRTSEFESFIVDELMPRIDAQYRTKRDPTARAMVGFYLGGLITTQICYNRPEGFSLCAAFSPAYWARNMAVFDQVTGGPKKNLKLYVDWGMYEGIVTQDARAMRDHLQVLGYEVSWKEWHEGHSMGSWRAHLDNALEYFFPAITVSVEDNEAVPLQFSLHQNYPNPFNPSTTISYDLPKSVHVTLAIYDVLGREVRKLVDETQTAGHHQIAWDSQNGFGSRVTSGLYFYRMKAGEFERTRKLMVVK